MRIGIFVFGVFSLCGSALGQSSLGTISCTSEVKASTCKAVTGELQSIQYLPHIRTVEFLIVDPPSFEREKQTSIDVVISKLVSSRARPMLHSSFDAGILFHVSPGGSGPTCPDRIVISTDLFRPMKRPTRGERVIHESGNQVTVDLADDFDIGLAGEYAMFILGYVDGCWGGQAR